MNRRFWVMLVMLIHFFLIFAASVLADSSDYPFVPETEEDRRKLLAMTEVPPLAEGPVRRVMESVEDDSLRDFSFRVFFWDYDEVGILCEKIGHHCNIYFSRKVFASLDRDEIFAVIAHEVGHLVSPCNECETGPDDFAIGAMKKCGVRRDAFVRMLRKIKSLPDAEITEERIERAIRTIRRDRWAR